jgi:parvulin-like peptidyl-prolyl isomerase
LSQIDQQLAYPAILGQSILDSMIDDVLIRKEADARGITVDESEIDKSLEEGFGYYPEGTPTFAPTPTVDATRLAAPTSTPTEGPSPTPTASPTPGASPTATLSPTPRPTATTFTQQAYETAVKDYLVNLKGTMGATESDLRSRIEASLYRQKLQDAIGEGVPAEQDEVWAKHILVADEATANEVLAKIKAGEDWDALASQYSADTSNKDKGGDLGWFPRGQMVSEFETAAFEATVGEIVGPVQTSFGWHIIKVEGHEIRPLDAATLAGLRQKAFSDWLTSQRDKTDVVTTPGWEQYAPTVPGFPTPAPNP